MAKLSSDGKYVTVESGDTLSAIARTYGNGKTYQQLAEINNIKNPNYITVGQKIYLSKDGSGSSSPSTTNTVDPYKPVVKTVGRQTSNVNTLLAVWTFGKESETEKYETWWQYDLGDGVWYVDKGSVDTDVEAVKYDTWSIKANTKSVKFRVKAVPKKKSDGKTNYFESKWSDFTTWNNSDPLPIPEGLTIKIEDDKLTATVPSIAIEGSTPPTHVFFQVIQNDIKVFATASATIKRIDNDTSVTTKTGTASWTCTVTPGADYKARCYAYYKSGSTQIYSDWSAPTDNTPAVPAKVASITEISAIREVARYGIYLKWAESKTAESYEIAYSTNKSNLEGGYDTDYVTVEDKKTAWKIYDLDPGKEYFVRIRAKNGTGTSPWSDIKSAVLGTKPIEPTTWSSTTTAIVGEDVLLYWVHNSADGSSQTEADLKLVITIDGIVTTHNSIKIPNLTSEEKKDKTRFCTIYTKGESNAAYIGWDEDSGPKEMSLGVTFREGAKIDWQVKTKGIHADYGEYSIKRTIDIHAKPTLKLSIGVVTYYRVIKSGADNSPVYTQTNEALNISVGAALDGVRTTEQVQVYSGTTTDGERVLYCCEISELVVDGSEVSELPTISSFPFYISAIPGPPTQLPLSYHMSITANTGYETVDSLGNFKMVSAGEQVYSKFFDVKHDLLVAFTPGNIDLETGISYTVTCTVAMNSGLSTEYSIGFVVGWIEMKNVPNAEISIDPETLTASIQPYCREYRTEYRKVEKSGRSYIVTDTVYDFACVSEITNPTTTTKPASIPTTTTGERVYTGSAIIGDTTYENIYYCEVTTETQVEGVYLSVYRREFDGSFTELATMLDGANNTTITDPHPALDLARYRVVATSKTTGAVSYYDLPGVPVNGNAVIIQWDEAWSSFEATEDAQLAEPEWSGSMLKLPYNIDVSDSTDPEVEMVQYVGRKHPVSYYGTHRGQTSSWNVVIEKDDEETLYGLRRLAMWMGDVYVREPSGSGYWANIKVSFNQKHSDLTIPVALNITRVEGGI